MDILNRFITCDEVDSGAPQATGTQSTKDLCLQLTFR